MKKEVLVVGFFETVETEPSIWVEQITKRQYYGEVSYKKWSDVATDTINTSPDINVKLSIVGDDFAFSHLPYIRYVEYAGEAWEVVSVTPKRPRIEIEFKGVYNE